MADEGLGRGLATSGGSGGCVSDSDFMFRENQIKTFLAMKFTTRIL
jgi:hypothetical protein